VIKALYKRNGVNVEPDDSHTDLIVKKENVILTCQMCKEEKPVIAFGVTDSGRHKNVCLNCELDQMQVKGQPEVKGKGKAMFNFPSEKKCNPADWKERRSDKCVGTIVANNLKTAPEKVDSDDDELDRIVESIPENKPKLTALNSKDIKKEMLDSEAHQLFDIIIKTYLEEYKDGFTNKDIFNHLHGKRGTQWIYAKLKRMVAVGLLNVEKRGGVNVYFVNKIVPQPTRKEKIENEKIEKFAQKVDSKKKLPPFRKDHGFIESKFREVLEHPTSKMTFVQVENMNDNLIKNMEEIADKMLINFTEKSTTITVSPTHNILRAYDLLSDKQKESAEISDSTGKMLKFSW